MFNTKRYIIQRKEDGKWLDGIKGDGAGVEEFTTHAEAVQRIAEHLENCQRLKRNGIIDKLPSVMHFRPKALLSHELGEE